MCDFEIHRKLSILGLCLVVAERASFDGRVSVGCLSCDSLALIIALLSELVLRHPCPVTAARVVGPQVLTYFPVLRRQPQYLGLSTFGAVTMANRPEWENFLGLR